MRYNLIFFGIAVIIFFSSCSQENSKTLFSEIPSGKSGITFKNTLRETSDFNVMNYSYFYNGGGVATGDVNNDGLCDIFFTGNLVASHLYLNQGNWKFENIAKEAGIEAAGLWNTGVTMADVNGDGWLDIYICRSAAKDPEGRRNLLFINQSKQRGDAVTFKEEAAAYGLDDPSYSTHATFFDFDRDGDLDMYLLNHSVPEYSNFDSNIGQLKARYNPHYGDKLFRNDGGTFIDISQEAGIISNVLGFGLGVAIADVNNDGWPDIYVSNDFNEEDYLYINQKDGTFKEQLRDFFDYTSLFSMGSDVADINNDGLTDLVTLDMLPEDNYRIKLTSGADNFDKYQLLLKQGFYNQNMRNMLHLNQGTGNFAEVGQMAGVSNSDWSWSALIADYDLDGFQDLFVTNGYLRDYTNMDFLSFAVDLRVKEGATSDINDHIEEILQQMPRIDVPNKIYKNMDGLVFKDSSSAWGFTKIELSNGAAYADLDNDGDLDLVVNNVNDFAGVYRNHAVERKLGNFLKVRLDAPGGVTGAMGSHVALHTADLAMHRDLFISRGYQSSVEPIIYFGLGKAEKIDSLIITWTDGKKELFDFVPVNTRFIAKKGTGISKHPDGRVSPNPIFQRTDLVSFTHQENDFNDFRVQRLLPKYYSRSGPALASADINRDGLVDLIVAGAQGQPTQVFFQNSQGQFIPSGQPDLIVDSNFEDVDLVVADLNADGSPDLLIASGGNAYPDGDDHYALRLYLNDGSGRFTKSEEFPLILSNAHCVTVGDLNHDGFPDLFLGTGYKAQQFPLPGENYVLFNDGKGHFTLTGDLPFVSSHLMDAVIVDCDRDGQNEIIMVGEWEPVSVYSYKNGGWVLKYQSSEKGWYNTIHAANVDADQELEFIVGNLGLNSQWIASKEKPIINYFGDFDGNQAIDPILSCYIGEGSYPFVSRDDLISQIPSLKKFFTSYKDYAEIDMQDLLQNLPNPSTDTINELRTMIFDIQSNSLKAIPLPVEAQIAPVYSITSLDFDNDGDLDLLLTGNNEFNRVKLGEMSANHGVLLRNDGNLTFKIVPPRETGLDLRGDVRSCVQIEMGNDEFLIFGINNRPVISYQLNRNLILQ